MDHITNKHFLVVSGTKGIGHAIVNKLLEKGAVVTFTGRTTPQTLPAGANFIPSDLSTVRGTMEFGQRLKGKNFDSAVFTVGIISKSHIERNAEGLEMDLMVSYLSRFILIQFLSQQTDFPNLQRVFIFGYPGHHNTPTDIDDLNFEHTEYKQFAAHMNTVVLNEALVYETHRRFPHLQVYGLNPGLIETGIRDNVHGGKDHTWFGWITEKSIQLFNPSAAKYVDRVVFSLLADATLVPPACYSNRRKFLEAVGWVADLENRKRAWAASEALVTKILK